MRSLVRIKGATLGVTSTDSRRNILRTIAGAAGAIAAGPSLFAALQGPPQPLPSPNAPHNQNVPAGMDGPDIVKPDKPAINPLNQQQIAAAVEQLYKLASEMKDEIEHTNMTATLSLGFVKKAQQVEKLAKQIKDRAKG